METEKRLIDANALLEAYWEEQKKPGIYSIEKMILDSPIVDAVEVVRCKDCIHWYEPDGVCLKIYSDCAVSPYAWQDRNQNDFCSYGERKDNG